MNKAITDGIQLMPPPFSAGLDVWSRTDGTPGSPTYEGQPNATLIAADPDFGGCLELAKTDNTQRLRYMGDTPMLPGSYWHIRVRVKAVSGPLPNVRIGAWAGASGGSEVTGLVTVGTSTSITNYGEVFEASAIVGSGSRNGVDMVWGLTPVIGHFGLDLTGPNGGVVRIDDIIIEDVSSIYTRTLIDVVDVTDFGAVGDGVTDNVAAFNAADAAAAGKTTVLIPEGVFRLNSTTTMNSEVRFQGTVSMPAAARLELIQNFDFPTYFSAFGSEKLALEKAIQTLFNFSDHESLDLHGRDIQITSPIDVQAAVGNKTTYSIRRVIRNGRISASSSSSWADTVVSRSGNYSSGNPLKLTNVSNAGGIAVGSRVTAPTGVGREIYVTRVNASANEVTLSHALYGAPGTQTYTFTRHKYLLDFSGFEALSRFTLENMDFACNGLCSGVLLAKGGLIFHVKDSYFTSPKDKGLTSPGEGCAGMMLDRNQWLSNESALAVSQRKSIGFNTNADDVKIRNNRAQRFLTWGVVGGGGTILSGNHFFQGDPTGGTTRSAGIVFAQNSPKATITGNYIDQCYIDWTNEYDATPSITSGFSFSALTITGNHFTAFGVTSWFSWIQVKPYGTGHSLNGVSITGNVFKNFNGPTVTRVEKVDDSIAPLNGFSYRNLTVTGNTFLNVAQPFMNPVTFEVERSSPASTWQVDASRYLPFQAKARFLLSAIPQTAVRNSSNIAVYTLPYCVGATANNGQSFDIRWSEPVKGKIRATLRCDETY